jgi:hypothetical protein
MQQWTSLEQSSTNQQKDISCFSNFSNWLGTQDEVISTLYRFNTDENYRSKAILDYIVRKESFTPDKIPLLFVYTR